MASAREALPETQGSAGIGIHAPDAEEMTAYLFCCEIFKLKI